MGQGKPVSVATFFNHHFLLAMPGMGDPRFQHTVTYICLHDASGALGLVINKPLDLSLNRLLAQLNLPHTTTPDQAVYAGGPVEPERGFILHLTDDRQWQSSQALTEHLRLTASIDILESMAAGHGPAKSLLALGYAGWEAGQLEAELADNAWLTVEADEAILFDVPAAGKAAAAAGKLGFRLDTLALGAGHA